MRKIKTIDGIEQNKTTTITVLRFMYSLVTF